MVTDDCGLELAKAAAEGAGKESVNKIAAVIGGVFPFFGAKRQAVTTYISDIQNSNLSPEAKMMAIANAKKTYKQLKNQCNIAQIAQDAAKEGTDFSPSSDVDDEWLERFMDSAKFVSDEEVQTLWGNVLAKEFELPNSTPPSVIRILTEITPAYAKAFSNICRMGFYIIREDATGINKTGEYHVVVPVSAEFNSFLSSYNINFSLLNELDMLGLIRFDSLSGYCITLDNTVTPVLHLYCDNSVKTVTKYPDKAFPVGNILLTKAGMSIQRFIPNHPISEYFEKVSEYLHASGVEFSEHPQIKIKINGDLLRCEKQ